jgi:excisionase family DNA binding protein
MPSFMVDADVVASCLSISPSAVYQLVRRNEFPIPAHRFGRAVRFKKSDLESFLGVTLDEVSVPQ